MAELKPFRALRYDPAAAGASLDQLVAPPYDVIPDAVLQSLAAASEFNIVRLIRPHEPELAAERFADWQARGILVREETPAVWRLEEEFVGPDGVRRTRVGLVARVRVHPFEEGVVFPHERTFDGPMQMRLRLIRGLRTKVSPVLMLHAGASPPVLPGPPQLEATLGGSTSRLWRIDDPALVAETIAAVKGPLVIADGHHRYTASLRYFQEQGTEESAFTLATLVSRDDPGLEIFPTHRLVSVDPPPLPAGFGESPLAGDVRACLDRLGEVGRDHPAFVRLDGDGAVLAEERDVEGGTLERLDVSSLDRLGLEGVGYTAFVDEAVRAVECGEARAAFLVRAPTIEQVEDVATSGLVMPQKSTYFFPKLTSGLLLAPLDE